MKMSNPLDNARDAELVIERAVTAGITLDAGNVIDLLVDNLLHLTLAECREALRISSFRGRWPSAERRA